MVLEISHPKPPWLKVSMSYSKAFNNTRKIMRSCNLNTVCEEAACPNIGECWSKKHATFMIMGRVCTRACAFCNVATGRPGALDEKEPVNVANAVQKMGLNHVVITSVDRDDLKDGGAEHFAKCINEIHRLNSQVTVEVLTPDFRQDVTAALDVAKAAPDVYNHNIETVPRLYPRIRPGARYFNSLNLLYQVKLHYKNIFTKSGFMLGLGETNEEISQILDDLRSAGVDFVTIGQYLRPSIKHAPLHRYVSPNEFEYYGRLAKTKGFLMVSSSPLTRSSYHAGDDFAVMKAERAKRISEGI